MNDQKLELTIRQRANRAWNNLNFAQHILRNVLFVKDEQVLKLLREAQEDCDVIVKANLPGEPS